MCSHTGDWTEKNFQKMAQLVKKLLAIPARQVNACFQHVVFCWQTNELCFRTNASTLNVTPVAYELTVATRARQFLCCRGILFSLFSLFVAHTWVLRRIIISWLYIKARQRGCRLRPNHLVTKWTLIKHTHTHRLSSQCRRLVLLLISFVE